MTTAVVYDEENYPNFFALSVCPLGEPHDMRTYEISERRDDRWALMDYLNWCHRDQIEMIGFNNVGYDYPILHWFYNNAALATNAALYDQNLKIINRGNDRFGSMIWQSDRLAPQIDLYLINHFDNVAKVQSLKGLEFNMHSERVLDIPVPPGTFLTADQIANVVIPYGRYDVRETNRFAGIMAPNIAFRRSLRSKLRGDVLNFNDTKIGKQMFEQRLGDDLCFTRVNGRKEPRQTPRGAIPVRDILFPYIMFRHPEFRRVHEWLLGETITETKGGLKIDFKIGEFPLSIGTGGIHGSVYGKVFRSDAEHVIIDLDVAGQYPNIAIANLLRPEHLGLKFVEVYSGIVAERKLHKKGTVENAALKLATTGPYGDSNSPFSPLYDPKYTMSVTMNGQMLISMLIDWLVIIPTVEFIQVNTDGVTIKVHRAMQSVVKDTCDRWQKYTMLVLESVEYKRMFIRDVNNYIGEYEDGSIKKKGAYWYPRNFDDISNASPSAWHKDLSCIVVQRAAEAAMIYGADPVQFINNWPEKFDFMLRAKVPRGSNLFIGDRQVQRITRYYIANHGGPLRKISPPTGEPGGYKRKNGITEMDWVTISRDIPPGTWDARIHTANKSTYEDRNLSFNAGWLVAECNLASDFDWSNLNRQWYIDETRKLIVQ